MPGLQESLCKTLPHDKTYSNKEISELNEKYLKKEKVKREGENPKYIYPYAVFVLVLGSYFVIQGDSNLIYLSLFCFLAFFIMVFTIFRMLKYERYYWRYEYGQGDGTKENHPKWYYVHLVFFLSTAIFSLFIGILLLAKNIS